MRMPDLDSRAADVLLDITQPVPLDTWSAAMGAVFIALGVFYLSRRERPRGANPRTDSTLARSIPYAGRVLNGLLGIAFILIGGGGAAWFVVMPQVRAANLRTAAASARAVTTDGVVSGLRDDPAHRALSWTIVASDGPRTFTYSESSLGTGMREYDRLRTAVRDGQDLRVTSVDGDLVRIEIP